MLVELCYNSQVGCSSMVEFLGHPWLPRCESNRSRGYRGAQGFGAWKKCFQKTLGAPVPW